MNIKYQASALLILVFGEAATATMAEGFLFRRGRIVPSPSSSSLDDIERHDLLMGYDLLGNILGFQGKVWLLPILRVLTLSSRPVEEVKCLTNEISVYSKRRAQQLVELRKLPPDVSGKFIPPSQNPMGKAIGDVVKWKIIRDMTDRSREFDLNFALMEVAALRMIASTAKALIPFEKNRKRRKWLREVAGEYQSLRGELKEIIKKYIRGEGAEQTHKK